MMQEDFLVFVKHLKSKMKTLADLNPKYGKTMFTIFILNISSDNCR
jgi:hypothetical protein